MCRFAEPVQLSVHGLRSEETDSLTDPTLLAEILEAREELEEAASHDEVDDIRKANHGERTCHTLADVVEKVEETIAAIKAAFSSEPPDFEGARTLAIQLKYWLGLEAAAKEWTPK
jgi:molecular chaperone HscB